jgi:hypothetical protein
MEMVGEAIGKVVSKAEGLTRARRTYSKAVVWKAVWKAVRKRIDLTYGCEGVQVHGCQQSFGTLPFLPVATMRLHKLDQ